MALKPTIYKAHIDLSDMDRQVYSSLDLTVAQHPSETIERMMVRILAFCLNQQANLQFTKGLSTPDEPDIWAKEYDDSVSLWVDVGEPLPERMKKAARVAAVVKVFTFNSKSDVWWSQQQKSFRALDVEVWQFQWNEVQQLVNMVERTMNLSVTVSDNTVYVSSTSNNLSLDVSCLQ